MRWVFEFINEWRQLLEPYNWYTMTFFHMRFECEKMAWGYEFEFILLGLGIRIRYNTDKSFEQFAEWDEEMKDAEPMSLEEWERATLEDLEKHL